jgi:hypothetical protein
MTTLNESAELARFKLDETKARAFLRRALRRLAGDPDVDAEGGGNWEDWDLNKRLSRDDVPHVEDLVYQAIPEADAIVCPPGVRIDLLTDAQDGDRMYQWRITFSVSAGFALCSPFRQDVSSLGSDRGGIRAQGCRTALGVLHEAVQTGNQLLAAYAQARGRIPAVEPEEA